MSVIKTMHFYEAATAQKSSHVAKPKYDAPVH